MKFVKKLMTIFDFVNNAAAFLAGTLLFSVMCFVTVAVFLRYVVNRPIGWVVEVCEYSLVCMTFLVAAWVLRKEGHVRVDLVLSLLDPRTQYRLNAITSAMSTVVCLVLTFFAGKVTRELFRGDYFTPTILMIPKFIFIGFITFGCFLLSIQFIRRTYRYLQNWKA